jgi:hypothetical protein
MWHLKVRGRSLGSWLTLGVIVAVARNSGSIELNSFNSLDSLNKDWDRSRRMHIESRRKERLVRMLRNFGSIWTLSTSRISTCSRMVPLKSSTSNLTVNANISLRIMKVYAVTVSRRIIGNYLSLRLSHITVLKCQLVTRSLNSHSKISTQSHHSRASNKVSRW